MKKVKRLVNGIIVIEKLVCGYTYTLVDHVVKAGKSV